MNHSNPSHDHQQPAPVQPHVQDQIHLNLEHHAQQPHNDQYRPHHHQQRFHSNQASFEPSQRSQAPAQQRFFVPPQNAQYHPQHYPYHQGQHPSHMQMNYQQPPRNMHHPGVYTALMAQSGVPNQMPFETYTQAPFMPPLAHLAMHVPNKSVLYTPDMNANATAQPGTQAATKPVEFGVVPAKKSRFALASKAPALQSKEEAASTQPEKPASATTKSKTETPEAKSEALPEAKVDVLEATEEAQETKTEISEAKVEAPKTEVIVQEPKPEVPETKVDAPETIPKAPEIEANVQETKIKAPEPKEEEEADEPADTAHPVSLPQETPAPQDVQEQNEDVTPVQAPPPTINYPEGVWSPATPNDARMYPVDLMKQISCLPRTPVSQEAKYEFSLVLEVKDAGSDHRGHQNYSRGHYGGSGSFGSERSSSGTRKSGSDRDSRQKSNAGSKGGYGSGFDNLNYPSGSLLSGPYGGPVIQQNNSFSRQGSRGPGQSNLLNTGYSPSMGGKSQGKRQGGGGGHRYSDHHCAASNEPAINPDDLLPMKTTENRWTKFEKKDLSAMNNDERKAYELLMFGRQCKSLLNKLTNENIFDTAKHFNENLVPRVGALDPVTNLPMRSENSEIISFVNTRTDLVIEFINIIFDKALDEPKFCRLYATFFGIVHGTLAKEAKDFKSKKAAVQQPTTGFSYAGAVQPTAQPVKTDDEPADPNYPNIRKLMLPIVQKKFEGEKEFAKHDVNIAAEDEDEKLVRAKLRILGNIKFIGELYLVRLVNTQILKSCYYTLLKTTPEFKDEEGNGLPSESMIECLCNLLKTLNYLYMDKPLEFNPLQSDTTAQTTLRDALTTLSKKKTAYSSRIRFMLIDTIEVSPEEVARFEQQILANKSSAGGSNVPQTAPTDANNRAGLTLLGPNNNGPSFARTISGTRQPPQSPTSQKPGSGLRKATLSYAQSIEAGAAGPSAAGDSSAGKKPIFGANQQSQQPPLQQQQQQQQSGRGSNKNASRGGSRAPKKLAGMASEGTMDTSSGPSKTLSTTPSTSTTASGSARTTAPGTPVDALSPKKTFSGLGLDEETKGKLGRSIKSAVEDYISTTDIEELDYCFKADVVDKEKTAGFTGDYRPLTIYAIRCLVLLPTKHTLVEPVCKALSHLIKPSGLPVSLFYQSLELLAPELEELVFDAPVYRRTLAKLLSNLSQTGVLQFSDLQKKCPEFIGNPVAKDIIKELGPNANDQPEVASDDQPEVANDLSENAGSASATQESEENTKSTADLAINSAALNQVQPAETKPDETQPAEHPSEATH